MTPVLIPAEDSFLFVSPRTNHRVRFDLDQPFWVEQGSNNDCAGDWLGDAEDLTVDAGDRVGICYIYKKNAREHNIGETGLSLFKRSFDHLEAATSLGCGIAYPDVFTVCANCSTTRDKHVVVRAYCT